MVSGIRLGSAGLALWAVFTAGQLRAAVVVYLDQTAFEAAAGGNLSEERFAIAGIPGTGLLLGPLNAMTNRPPVVPGTIVDGITFRSLPEGSDQFLFLAPQGFVFGFLPPLSSTVLLTLNEGQPLFLDFLPDVSAVAADVLGFQSASGSLAIGWAAELADGTLHTGTLHPLVGQTVFFGLTTVGSSSIRRLSFQPPLAGYVAVDNVLFAAAQPPIGVAVPEPGSLTGWCLLAGALVIAAGKRYRKRIC